METRVSASNINRDAKGLDLLSGALLETNCMASRSPAGYFFRAPGKLKHACGVERSLRLSWLLDNQSEQVMSGCFLAPKAELTAQRGSVSIGSDRRTRFFWFGELSKQARVK